MTFSTALKTTALSLSLASAFGACAAADNNGPDPERLQAAGYVNIGVARQVPAPADLAAPPARAEAPAPAPAAAAPAGDAKAPAGDAKAPAGDAKAPSSVLVLADGTMYEGRTAPADELRRLAALLDEMSRLPPG
ncbi:MAG TPA: hypothetical protein VFS00_20810, partial [Polyangiaceae bacterium]|nr:hypothetical protein [Polyangiaceae bacterium]